MNVLETIKKIIFGFLALTGIAWVMNALSNKQKLLHMEQKERIDGALKEASKAIAHLTDDQLDSSIRKHIGSDDDTTH